MSIKKILCPVDLSPISRRALAYAGAISRTFGGRLLVLKVADQALGPRVRRAAADEVRAFMRPVRTVAADAEVLLESGYAEDEILRAASASRADLIVMGTHGRSGFERFVLGSVTEHVLRKAVCPVLAVPPSARLHPGAAFRTIVCAVDFSPASLRALQLAEALAAPEASLILVHAIAWPFGEGIDQMPPVIGDLRRSLERDALEKLRHAGAHLREDLAVRHLVTAAAPHADVVRVARETGADLIVAGLHSQATAAVALLGSTTRRVLHEAACPVLTVCAPRRRAT